MFSATPSFLSKNLCEKSYLYLSRKCLFSCNSIQVNVGNNLKLRVGQIRYKSDFPMYMGITIAAAVVIAFIIAISVICYKRQHPHTEKRNQGRRKPLSVHESELNIEMAPVSDLMTDLSVDFDSAGSCMTYDHSTFDSH